MYLFYFGGMIAVPLDKGLTDIEIENSLLRADVDAIIYENKYEEIIEKIKNERKVKYKRIYLYGKSRRQRVYKRYY